MSGPLHPVASLPVARLDPDLCRERLDELERDVDVQAALVDRLDTLLSDERRDLDKMRGERDRLLAHPAVRAALQLDRAP